MYEIEGPEALKPDEIRKLRMWGVITKNAYKRGMTLHKLDVKDVPGMRSDSSSSKRFGDRGET